MTGAAISEGIAAHITAASAGGPRYDAGLTAEQRRAPENGIWLCTNCARVIDSVWQAFPTETLRTWQELAAVAAARDLHANQDQIRHLADAISEACSQILTFELEWKRNEPQFDFNQFQESVQAQMEYGGRRMSTYHQQITPLTTDIIIRARAFLGSVNPVVQAAEIQGTFAHVNYIAMRMFADQLQSVRSALLLY